MDDGFITVVGERVAEDAGGEAHENAGLAILALCDGTGDGTPDLLLGIPYDDIDGNDSGSVILISGSDRSLG